MNDESFCGVGNFPMLIPYEQVVKMVETATKLELLDARFDRLQKQHDQLRSMYFELLEKLGELQKMM